MKGIARKAVDLEERARDAYKLLEACRVCPRGCGANRLKGERDHCQVAEELVVSSFGPHFGEEPELVGRYGSGTIFLTSCNLRCCFCQNYDISQLRHGDETSVEEFVGMMLALQNRGCHNINFVSPTHFAPQILKAIWIAKAKGLDVPLVYNSGGYDSVEMLRLFDGIIDIYMPDAKYGVGEVARRLSNAPNYPTIMKEALKEMHRQVGDLVVDKDGIAQSGLIIRHLVLPNDLAGTSEVMHFIATELSMDSYVNIMDQYRPCYKGLTHPEVNRYITMVEYRRAKDLARREGLHRGF